MKNILSMIVIANDINSISPKHATVLRHNIKAIIAANPEAKSFIKNVDKMLSVLKSMKQSLTEALEKIEDETMKEFAKWFTSEAEAEEYELDKLLNETRKAIATTKIAGPIDYIKNLFKGKGKKSKEPEADVSEANYSFGDKDVDEWIEGDREWSAEHSIAEERKQNTEFFDGVESAVHDMDKLRKKPTKSSLESLLNKIDNLISKGKKLVEGVYDTGKAPGKLVEEDGSSKKEQKKDQPKGKLDMGMVQHYADMISENSEDEEAVTKYLKELFETIKPFFKDERASLASNVKQILPTFIRMAYDHESTRKQLVPVIKGMHKYISKK